MHAIDMSNGRANVMVAGMAAWHKLGANVAEAQTSAEAIRLAGLDWEVERWPLEAVRDGRRLEGVPRVANVRSDTKAVLGVVGRGYRVIQNREAFDFMDELVREKLAMFETAGSLFGGKRIWVLARIPKEYRVAGDDLVQPYVLLTNGHDGTKALRIIPTTVRVVCANTLSLALGRATAAEGLTVAHQPNLMQRVEEARQKLGLLSHRLDRFAEEAEALCGVALSAEAAEAYFRAALGPVAEGKAEDAAAALKRREERVAALLGTWENERNALPGIRHTAWAALNAVTEWADHGGTYRGPDAAARLNTQVNSIWFGPANALKQRAYAEAKALLTQGA